MTSFDFSAPKPTFIEKLNEHLTSLELENSPFNERFGKGKYRDYLKFHYLLSYEKNQRQPQPLHPSPSPSDQLVIELDYDLELDEEEENNPDDLTFLKEMSAFSSKKSSIFSLNPTSKKGSLLMPNNTRHYSIRSDFAKKRDSFLPNFQAMIMPKRSSALVEPISQTEEDLKKRNSAILEDISSKLVSTQKTSTKKSLFEKIKRSSLRCNLSLSSLKSSDQSSNHSRESVNHHFIEEDDGFTESDDSASQSNGSDDESDLEDLKEEGYTKISFLKYENKKFKESKLGNQESVANLKKMNLLDEFFEEPITSFPAIDGKMNVEIKGEQKFRKFNILDKKYSKYQPYYLLNRHGVVKHRYQRLKRGKKNLYIARQDIKPMTIDGLEDPENLEKIHLDHNNESVFEFGSIVPKEIEPQSKSNYRCYVTHGDTSGNVLDNPKTSTEAYSMSFTNNCLYSESVNLYSLKDSTAKPRFQLKLMPSNTAVLVEDSLSQPVLNNYFGDGHDDQKSPGFCSNTFKGHCEHNICSVRDCGSKRGTFVKLKKNDPLTLQEGQLFLLNNRIGFYIKKPDEQHELEPQENLIYETICINKKSVDQPIISLAIPETKSSTTEMKSKSPKDSPGELKELLESKQCPSIKFELVRWNEKLEFYEEQGTIAFIYNNKEAIGCFEEGLFAPNLDYTTKNWIDLAEGSKFFGQIIKRLGLENQILLVYDTNMNNWHLEITSQNQGPTYGLTKNCEKIDCKEEIIQDFVVLPAIKDKCVEESCLTGLWLSISPFDILQEEFGNGWSKISVPSVMMFEDIVFKVSHEALLTLYKV